MGVGMAGYTRFWVWKGLGLSQHNVYFILLWVWRMEHWGFLVTTELVVFTGGKRSKRWKPRRYCMEVLDDGYLHHHDGPRMAMDNGSLLETTGVLVGEPMAVHR